MAKLIRKIINKLYWKSCKNQNVGNMALCIIPSDVSQIVIKDQVIGIWRKGIDKSFNIYSKNIDESNWFMTGCLRALENEGVNFALFDYREKKNQFVIKDPIDLQQEKK